MQQILKNGYRKTILSRPRGIYIHGTTGTGKTTAMHEFFDATNARKIAIHFNDYSLEISKLLQKFSIIQIAKIFAKRIDVLCFDEFYIESIADGRILFDLFRALHTYKVIIVLTSNFAPQDLYKDGFNRKVLFPEFSDFLLLKMDFIQMDKGDFRKDLPQDFQINFANQNDMALMFGYTLYDGTKIIIDDNHTATPITQSETCAIFSFEYLFKNYRNIKDYTCIARNFHHIHVSNMESFSYANEDCAIRFRNFIDVLYARNLIFTFDGFLQFDDSMLKDIKFMRTQSRIFEMSSMEYIYHPLQQQRRKWNIDAKEFFEKINSM